MYININMQWVPPEELIETVKYKQLQTEWANNIAEHVSRTYIEYNLASRRV